jgi:hypothetical protein
MITARPREAAAGEIHTWRSGKAHTRATITIA